MTRQARRTWRRLHPPRTRRPHTRLERLAARQVEHDRHLERKAYRRWRREAWLAHTEHAPRLARATILPLVSIVVAIAVSGPGAVVLALGPWAHIGGQLMSSSSWINVKDFGAMGDGSRNDNTAITNAIAFVSGGSASASSSTTGGALFFPPGLYISNSTITVTPRVWLVGTGYSESPSHSVLRMGAAMTVGVLMSGVGSALQTIQVDDPSPFVSTALVRVTGDAWNVMDCRLNVGSAAVPALWIDGANRGRCRGSRIVGDQTLAGTIGIRTSGFDCHFYGGCEIVAARSLSIDGGLNTLFDDLHLTGGTGTSENILITVGEGVMTNVETDASNNGGASVKIIPTAGSLARLWMTGCHFLSANAAASTPMVETDSTAANSRAIAIIDGCSSRAAPGNEYAYIVRKRTANDMVSVSGGIFIDCLTYWDTAFQPPDIMDNVTLATGAPPNVTTKSRFAIARSADFTVNNDNVLNSPNNDVPTMAFGIAANERCTFRAVLYVDATATADGQIDFTGPAAPTLVKIGAHTLNAAGAYNEATVNAFAAALVIGCAGAGTTIMVIVEGTIINGANAGTVQLRWAQNTAEATNAVVRSGSFLEKSLVLV